MCFFFFSSRRRHTRSLRDWSSDVCSSDLFDLVDLSNLQRQILHGTSGIGSAKTESARARLRDINPHVRVATFAERLTSANALTILRDFDIVVDGSDNFPTRYLVNDACVLLGKPDVYGS